MHHKLVRWLTLGAGLLIAVVGLLTFWLPIPIGLPLLLVGVALLVRVSSSARRVIVGLMRRYPRLRQLRQRARGRTGIGIGRPLNEPSGPAD